MSIVRESPAPLFHRRPRVVVAPVAIRPPLMVREIFADNSQTDDDDLPLWFVAVPLDRRDGGEQGGAA